MGMGSFVGAHTEYKCTYVSIPLITSVVLLKFRADAIRLAERIPTTKAELTACGPHSEQGH
jgi:hypothetical protein